MGLIDDDMMTVFMRTRACERMLVEYAKRQISMENIWAWKDLNETRRLIYRNGSPEKIIHKQDSMILEFIQQGSENEINISHELRTDLMNSPRDQGLWEQVRSEVCAMILGGPYFQMAKDVEMTLNISWKKACAKHVNPTVGVLFYQQVWNMDPNLKEIFNRHPIAKQHVMFETMIGTCLQILASFPEFFSLISQLGLRHSHIRGIEKKYFNTMSAALLKTMESALGPKDFDLRTRKCWFLILDLISTIMQLNMFPGEDPVELPTDMGGEESPDEDISVHSSTDSTKSVSYTIKSRLASLLSSCFICGDTRKQQEGEPSYDKLNEIMQGLS